MPPGNSSAIAGSTSLPALSPSDLLSEQLEVYSRDKVYEAAVRAV